MKHLFTLLALVIVTLAGAGCGRAQDDLHGQGVHLRSDKLPPTGSVLRKTTEFLTENRTLSFTAQGQELKAPTTSRHTTVVETEILSPDKVRIMHIKDSQSHLDEYEEKTTTGPLQGVAVLGKKEGGKWTYKLESGTATPEQSKKLKEMSDGTADVISYEWCYPDHYVNVGDRWELDSRAKTIKTSLGSDGLTPSSTDWMELRELTTHGGHECAHLFFNFQSKVTSQDVNIKTTYEAWASGEIYRALDLLQDVSVTTKGEYNVEYASHDGETKIQMNMPMTINASTVLK